MDNEYAFEMAVSAVRFGAGVTREVGADLQALGVRRALVITDPTVARLAAMQTVLASLEAAGVDFEVFDRVRVEPTDESFLEAIAFANRGNGDGFVAVGGGSAIDTAKAANLYSTYPPADFLDYVNPPVGKGLPVPGPLKPLIAIPTTAGTGSETTGVSIFDLTRLHAKTGIASRLLKPTLGLVDPENTRTLPPEVAASSGLDILSHALESFTAHPLHVAAAAGPSVAPARLSGIQPDQRRLVAAGAATRRTNSSSAPSKTRRTTRRGRTCCWPPRMPASASGMPACTCRTACRIPVSGQVRDYRAPGYAADHPLVPHGISVILNAPAVFRFTAAANPGRHLAAAEALGADDRQRRTADAGEILADRITWFMQRLNVPNGLRAVGYTSADIPALVEGTLPQHRVTKLSPRPAGPEDLRGCSSGRWSPGSRGPGGHDGHAFRQDLLYALRVLGKDRAYAAAVILTLAVCLGANTAIFTVVRSVLLRPLPYPELGPAGLLLRRLPRRRRRARGHVGPELRRPAGDDRRVLVGRALSVRGYRVGEGARAESVSAMNVTPSFFQVLGATAARGRLFTEAEGTPGKNKVALLSHALPRGSRAASTASSDATCG